MTKKETANLINTKYSDQLFNLSERWRDEKDYEDLQDYVDAFKKLVPGTYKGSKRPFGFVVKCDDGNMKVLVKNKGYRSQIFFEHAK